MKYYYYEYKYKNGCKVGGHNLIEIEIYDDYIKLWCKDILNTTEGIKADLIPIVLNKNEIKYLKLAPMQNIKYEYRPIQF